MDGAPTPLALRPPETVMRLARMGSFHPTRLSFMRILLRRVEKEQWRIDRPIWDIDKSGVGRAVYRVSTPSRRYSLVAFAHDLPDHLRSDRVIAEAWDATFVLFDGEPSPADLDRLANEVPLQEAGRMSPTELTLSRANRSARLFSHVVEALANSRQPAADELLSVGYLMRTTAVYGSGKFGLSDREAYADRPELAAPFQAEMLTVWLIRAFTVDIVEHLARTSNLGAARLAPKTRRALGVGNSTGLGMAPFLISHPALVHAWMSTREEALSRVRALAITPDSWAVFRRAVRFAKANAASWWSDHSLQQRKIADLRMDLQSIASQERPSNWDTLWRWGEATLTLEGQEVLFALMLEPHWQLVDDLSSHMSVDEEASFPIDADGTTGALAALIARNYKWATETDWDQAEATARLWYVSAEKLEPRLAERADEPLDYFEQPLGPARDVAALAGSLIEWPADTPLSKFLQSMPQHRHAVRRVQIVAGNPYAEVRDNTLSQEMLPIDLLRAKLSFFGATRFDPKSDRWVRISMFQGAPFPDEVGRLPMDHWMYG
ncbi:MAG: hypothetical protein AAF674_10040 [Pseudomonadota bacterium]